MTCLDEHKNCNRKKSNIFLCGTNWNKQRKNKQSPSAYTFCVHKKMNNFCYMKGEKESEREEDRKKNKMKHQIMLSTWMGNGKTIFFLFLMCTFFASVAFNIFDVKWIENSNRCIQIQSVCTNKKKTLQNETCYRMSQARSFFLFLCLFQQQQRKKNIWIFYFLRFYKNVILTECNFRWLCLFISLQIH